MTSRVVVVGASLAGATAAFSLRDAGFTGEVVLVGDEPEIPYERPALSKRYLSQQLERERLLVRPAADYELHRIDLRLGHAATGLDVEERTVLLASGEQLSYDVLVIATGAANVQLPVPGASLAGVHQLRSVADADALIADLPGARTAVVVGQGFVGGEVAATLTELGLAVTSVDPLPGPLWGPLGPELSGVVRRWHEQRGVSLRNGVGVVELLPGAGGERVAGVALSDGSVAPADLVVVGVGARPSTGWLLGTPVGLVDGAVAVDAEGRTSVADVYAAGDVAARWDAAAGRHVRREHWDGALDQGRRVAAAVGGLAPAPAEAPTFWSDLYDHRLQYAGSADADCELVVRGDLLDAGAPLLAFFVRSGTLAAVLAVDAGKELRRALRLIGSAVDAAALADPAVDLRRLAPLARRPLPGPTAPEPAARP